MNKNTFPIMTKLNTYIKFAVLFIISGTAFADYDYIVKTNYFNNVDGLDGIIIKSKFFGFQSAINRDVTDARNAYDYGPFILQDLNCGKYRLYTGGRWRRSALGPLFDGDHVLQFTSETGKGNTWAMPHDRPEINSGQEDGYLDVWFSGNYLEPEVLKVNSSSYYMYTQVQINSNENIDVPVVPAMRNADRFQLLKSTNGLDWTRWSTNRGVFINIAAPRYTHLHHEEVIYASWDSNTPYWIYFFADISNTANNSFRIRSDDPTTFDYQNRERCTGIAQLGNQIGYTANGPGNPLLIRITFTDDGTGRQVPSLQFSENGRSFSQGLKGYSLMDGSKNNVRNENTYFLGLSSIDGLGKFEYLGNNTYRTIYAATTSKSPYGPDIMFAEVGVGELIFQLIPKISAPNLVNNGTFDRPVLPENTSNAEISDWAHGPAGIGLNNPIDSQLLPPFTGQNAYFNGAGFTLMQTFTGIILRPNTMYTVSFDAYTTIGNNKIIRGEIYQGSGAGKTSSLLHHLNPSDIKYIDYGNGYTMGTPNPAGAWFNAPTNSTPANDSSLSHSFSFITSDSLTSPRPSENLGLIIWGGDIQVVVDNVKVEIRPINNIVPSDNYADGNFITNYDFDFPAISGGTFTNLIKDWARDGNPYGTGIKNPFPALPDPFQGQVAFIDNATTFRQTFPGKLLVPFSLYTVSFDACTSIGNQGNIYAGIYQGSGAGTNSVYEYILDKKDVNFFNPNDGAWLGEGQTDPGYWYSGAAFTIITNTVDAHPFAYSHSFSFYTPQTLVQPLTDKNIGIQFWGVDPGNRVLIDNVVVKRIPVPEPSLFAIYFLSFIIFYFKK